jgi:membrane-bound lytic murein transglycosylase D
MATLHIIKNPEYYGLDAVSVHRPVEYEIVTISKQVHLKNVAKHTGIEEKVLRELNPELRYRILPKENYSLRVPPEKSRVLLAALDKIPVSYPAGCCWRLWIRYPFPIPRSGLMFTIG